MKGQRDAFRFPGLLVTNLKSNERKFFLIEVGSFPFRRNSEQFNFFR